MNINKERLISAEELILAEELNLIKEKLKNKNALSLSDEDIKHLKMERKNKKLLLSIY